MLIENPVSYRQQNGTPMKPLFRHILSLIIILLLVTPLLAAEPPKEPILRIESGMHTAMIRRIATDTSDRWLVTASDDKSLRVWELPAGRLIRTIRPPIGEGDEGKLDSVALSPDGATIACGGWTQYNNAQSSLANDGYTIYLFNRASGNLTTRITGLPTRITHLTFSLDGRYLAASLKEKAASASTVPPIGPRQLWGQVTSLLRPGHHQPHPKQCFLP
jgi:WD40 repeat protein